MSKKKTIDQLADEIIRDFDAGDTPEAQARAALQQAADAGGGGLRQQYLQTAQAHIARVDGRRNPKLVQELQANVLALQGRGGDTRIAHLTNGELVIPAQMLTPDFMQALAAEARARGIDPRSLFVGSRQNAVNPRTGLMEFGDDDDSDAPQPAPQSNPRPPLQSLQDFHPDFDSLTPLPTPDISLPEISVASGNSYPMTFQGDASYYNKGKITASGEPFDPNASAAAMRKPVNLGDTATVQLQQSPYTSITVPINDRGPFAVDSQGHTVYDDNGHALPHPTRVIDLTERAFKDLVGDTKQGHVPVTVTVNPKPSGR